MAGPSPRGSLLSDRLCQCPAEAADIRLLSTVPSISASAEKRLETDEKARIIEKTLE
jgi:hypothetical protein